MQKIILLNAGSATRTAFQAGITQSSFEHYKSKEIILHIKGDLSLSFISSNTPINFENSYVFTRLRANDTHFCGILYEHLHALGIATSDPITLSFKMSEEKIAQMGRLARAGIRIPQTIIAREESYEANKTYILEHIQFPLVYKTDGSRGKNVFKIHSQEELEDKIASKKPYELFLIQQLIPNTFDTRTLVAYGKVLGSIKRTAASGVFHNNVALGATVEKYELTDEEKEIALRATKACLLDFGGVDIIHTEQGPIVLEVNKSPQIMGFESIHGKDTVFSYIARTIEGM